METTVKDYGTGVTDLQQICDLYGVRTNKHETEFVDWDELPDVAILAVNLREEFISGRWKICWHWVVWNRERGCVFDPFPYDLDRTWNTRTDYKRLRPVSYIRVYA
jgi:hypothetical protein